MNKIRCIFMGTPQIAATILENMLQANIEVGLVVTQPDKKKGRKQNLVFSEVKEVAVQHGIEVFQPVRIKEDYQTILDYKPDIIVTCAYGQIVPKVILDAPVYGAVNLHGSLLPALRGGAPIQRAIWNGDSVSGMTLMKMAPKMDAGPILDVEKVEILDEDNSSSVFEKMAQAASILLLRNWDKLVTGQAYFVEQDENLATYAPVISKSEEHIDLNQDDVHIFNQIRALSNEPGAYFIVKNKKFKVLKARYMQSQVLNPMTFAGLVNDGFGLYLNEGILLIDQCQMEGKPVLNAKDFYNGMGRNLVGTRVE
ncbi:methionyl-tRNA formyltransferase [Floccifex sp.]|uniref:methionyl-tRNA formyltransferase n=1 Tax=Floccifex sp. TaxID=2815810 RepID=UPI002A75DD6A|nr:methionyl-tRNA formyltransferase [Floccifex sp.]MDD7282131.1 methionyl-tRNA formyltransferase [Erysipelotrichaceae bacterium]MDY2958284.1 methionyl-tRNA formyltransferase [Floccifex sp.]